MLGADVDDIRAFLLVVEYGSFSRAAERIGISASAVSQRVVRLESSLGVRLLHRTTRSVSTTAAGDQLHAEGALAIRQLEQAVSNVRQFSDRPGGALRISVPRMTIRYFTPLFGRFAAEYPDIQFEISVSDERVDIVKERFDAGIRTGDRVDRDMIALRIGASLRSVVVASQRYLDTHPPLLTPHDLLMHNCIRYRPDPHRGIFRWRFNQNGRKVDINAPGTLTVDDPELALQAAIDGIGLTYTTESYVEGLVADNLLTPLLRDYAWEYPGYHIYYPSKSVSNTPLKALVAFLRESVSTSA